MSESTELSNLPQTNVTSDITHLIAQKSDGLFRRVSSDLVWLNRGSVTDCNDAVKLGTYMPQTGCANCPPGHTVNTSDMIEWHGRSSLYGRQIYISLMKSGLSWIRTKTDNTWSDWYVYARPEAIT